MGQHDGTINLNEKERIAEPNDINGLILEISFTKIDMKSFFVSFFHKVYREFLQAVKTANVVELA